MKKNMGKADKGIRVSMALVIVALYLFDVIEGALAYVLLAFGAIFLITSFISFCPLYAPFGVNTSKKK